MTNNDTVAPADDIDPTRLVAAPEAVPTTPLVLGAMFFGTTIDEDSSFALLDRFVQQGGSWIDTADCYSFWTSQTGQGGDSERLLGRWLEARPGIRRQIRISTKLGAEPLGPDRENRGRHNGWAFRAAAYTRRSPAAWNDSGSITSTCCGCTRRIGRY